MPRKSNKNKNIEALTLVVQDQSPAQDTQPIAPVLTETVVEPIKKQRKPRKKIVKEAPAVIEAPPYTEDYTTLNQDYYQYHDNKCVTNHNELQALREDIRALTNLIVAKFDCLAPNMSIQY